MNAAAPTSPGIDRTDHLVRTSRIELVEAAREVSNLPRLALRILRVRWHILLLIASLAAMAHELLMQRASTLAHHHPMVSLVALAATVVVNVLGYAWMFHSCRSLTPTQRELAAEDEATTVVHVRDVGLLEGAFALALPFLIFYGAWGLFQADASDLVARTVVDLNVDSPLQQPLRTLTLAAAVALVIRIAFDQLAERWRFAGWRFGAAVFEASWLVFTFAIVRYYLPQLRGWVQERRIVVGIDRALEAAAELLHRVTGMFAGIAHAIADVLASISVVFQPVRDGLIGPALWLAIAAIALGCELDRDDLTPWMQRHRTMQAVGSRIPWIIRRPASLFYAELQEKYVPLVNGARLVFRAGLMPFLVAALWYGLALLAGAHVQKLVVWHVGSRPPFEYTSLLAFAGGQVVLVVNQVVEVAILVAGVEILLQRLTARTAARQIPTPT